MSSVHPIHTLYTGLLLVLHPSLFIQSLSKNCLSFRLPFQRESVCKGKAFFRNLQIFSKVFLKKFSEGSQKACGLSFLAPLHIRKVRYSGSSQHCLPEPQLCQSVIFSGSPSRKRLQRYRLFPFTQLLHHTFLQDFFRFLSNSLIYFMLYSIFFIAIRKRM